MHRLFQRSQSLIRARILGLIVTAACSAHTWPGGIQARLVWSRSAGVRVLDVRPGGPAARAGLRAGDRLLAISGVATADLNADELHSHLQGEVGSTVQLSIERAGKTLSLAVERAPYGSS